MSGRYAGKVWVSRGVMRYDKAKPRQISVPVKTGTPETVQIDVQPGYELVIMDRVETIDNIVGPLPALTVQIRRKP